MFDKDTEEVWQRSRKSNNTEQPEKADAFNRRRTTDRPRLAVERTTKQEREPEKIFTFDGIDNVSQRVFSKTRLLELRDMSLPLPLSATLVDAVRSKSVLNTRSASNDLWDTPSSFKQDVLQSSFVEMSIDAKPAVRSTLNILSLNNPNEVVGQTASPFALFSSPQRPVSRSPFHNDGLTETSDSQHRLAFNSQSIESSLFQLQKTPQHSNIVPVSTPQLQVRQSPMHVQQTERHQPGTAPMQQQEPMQHQKAPHHQKSPEHQEAMHPSITFIQQQELSLLDRFNRPEWIYRDLAGVEQGLLRYIQVKFKGPFTSIEMQDWLDNGFFHADLNIRHSNEFNFVTMRQFALMVGTQKPFLAEMNSVNQMSHVDQVESKPSPIGRSRNVSENISKLRSPSVQSPQREVTQTEDPLIDVLKETSKKKLSLDASKPPLPLNSIVSLAAPISIPPPPKKKWSISDQSLEESAPSLLDIQSFEAAKSRAKKEKSDIQKTELLRQETQRLKAIEAQNIALLPITQTGNPWGDANFQKKVESKQNFISIVNAENKQLRTNGWTAQSAAKINEAHVKLNIIPEQVKPASSDWIDSPKDASVKEWAVRALSVVKPGHLVVNEFISVLFELPVNDIQTLNSICDDALLGVTAINPRKFAEEFHRLRKSGNTPKAERPEQRNEFSAYHTGNRFTAVGGGGKKKKNKK